MEANLNRIRAWERQTGRFLNIARRGGSSGGGGGAPF